MKKNLNVLCEICKEVMSDMVIDGFYEKHLSVEQIEVLRKIKESHKMDD
jgi:hypothetical protein